MHGALSPTFATGHGVDGRIDQLVRKGAAVDGMITLGGGLPAGELFPRRALSSSFLRVISDPRADALQYGWAEGREGLRTWVTERLRKRGAEVNAEDVLITSGAQQALALAAQVLFKRGARIGCDAETYPGALDLFEARGLTPVAAEKDVDGFYVMPAVSNPHGGSMSEEARGKLLARARATGAAIVEDDAYAEIRFHSAPPRSLLADDREHVFHVGTISKTLCPGMRVGWLVVPPRYRQQVLDAKQTEDLQSNSLAQVLLEDFLAHNDYGVLVERASRFYGRRARHLARALKRRMPELRFVMPEGGFTLWAETDLAGDDRELLETAHAHGVCFDPGRSFRFDKQAAPIAMRISFATEPATKITEGVERLARAVAAYRKRAGAGAA
ncbi:aminotransferase-like domain-containing protein [Chondromyces apiculatus]|uniref:Transcriptional regulator, GntR family domain / Aspartate aminotransferase n=1 Tax=Chondromyces apiculatus DSM 436 TaxID=1192034 RepID=A0A017SXR5_9BACT|nr:PLP-dependent aminotransferase family protein [Chondromyces apiculatus]EYF01061.1 Transcriptional regulator, GntR family domain / Aspartate aminotransferase [Chondromyces apiculatus DSM 436]